jgi:hypothetical protein
MDTIRDSILQYMIRETFDAKKSFVLLLKIGILSNVSTWQPAQPTNQPACTTSQPNNNINLCTLIHPVAVNQNTHTNKASFIQSVNTHCQVNSYELVFKGIQSSSDECQFGTLLSTNSVCVPRCQKVPIVTSGSVHEQVAHSFVRSFIRPPVRRARWTTKRIDLLPRYLPHDHFSSRSPWPSHH